MNEEKNLTLKLQRENALVLLTESSSKDERHRLLLYNNWLTSQNRKWHQIDLKTYREYLLRQYEGRNGMGISERSAKAHLSTIRGRYQAILRDNKVRDHLYDLTPNQASPSDRKAFVDEIILRIENDIDPILTQIKIASQQDQADSAHLRLSQLEAETLLQAPGLNTLRGLRDTSLFALMLCTGLREAELIGLDAHDLAQSLSGETALHVRRGKGRKERLIPYGDLIWSLDITRRWMEHAGISRSAVFRGFYKGYKHVRNSRLTVRAINQILENYPVRIDGENRTVKPHDLRRTYAKHLYDAGVDLLAIRDNLGHADTRTTLLYIGLSDVEKRKPPAIYSIQTSSELNSRSAGKD